MFEGAKFHLLLPSPYTKKIRGPTPSTLICSSSKGWMLVIALYAIKPLHSRQGEKN